MPTLRRLFRLWGLYAALDFVWMTRDARSFAMYAASDALLCVGSVGGTYLLAARFDGVGPWSRDQVLFLLGFALLGRGLLDLFFGYNILFISRRIGRGQLDHVLVQPQPLWLTLLTEGFSPCASAATWLPGLLLLGRACPRVGFPASAGGWGLLAAYLLAAAVVTLSCSVLWSCLAFWAPRGAEEVSTSWMGLADQLRQFPLDGAGPVLQGALLTALPVGFLAWLPCRVLLGLERSPAAAALPFIAAALSAAAAVLFFRRGLHEYARTGSQRYDRLGHRG